MDKRTVGAAAESAAAAFISRHGHELMHRNWRCRYGEIDIISRKDSCVVFTEVRARGDNALVSPLASVNAEKQRRVIRSAYCYMAETGCALQPRFDICAVTLRPDGSAELEYYVSAFDGSAYFDGE